ncbi:hypothetical protein HAX54_009698 [Datura stramonium]|uniref:Uncharacterized protein n=1 Tax=Datura stramonium TaxID=4076 RepID=A0ABS8TH35_DATST|nr:hypothetical protein [Datura stramonium]
MAKLSFKLGTRSNLEVAVESRIKIQGQELESVLKLGFKSGVKVDINSHVSGRGWDRESGSKLRSGVGSWVGIMIESRVLSSYQGQESRLISGLRVKSKVVVGS